MYAGYHVFSDLKRAVDIVEHVCQFGVKTTF